MSAIANRVIQLSSFLRCLRLATPTHLHYSTLQLIRDAIADFYSSFHVFEPHLS
ncbi:hypothetical protein [Nostoc sp. LPT]|uniref:hypothetical protein n=1 Tax=Nostoc sp. LPT TaxID=2815387 RepID=UPI001D8E39C6|nr:hypothetical protein [Nostoc sp. LPT]MBN4003059.1 hypothetical protein [Nostoc sp. LPT]